MKHSHTMQERIEIYLNHRKLLGHVLRSIRSGLLNFASYVDNKGYTGPLTIDLAIEWATASKKNTRSSWARRLALIHGFAKYYKVIEPKTEIPPLNIYGSINHRPSPYIYTKKEIQNLLAMTKQLKSIDGIKPITYKYLLGLLASTGLRISEAIKLTEEDVDLKAGILIVRET